MRYQKVEKQLVAMIADAKAELLNSYGIKEIQGMIDRNIISVYDYSYNGFSIDELTGGDFANMLGTIKHGGSFPLLDSISTDILGAVVGTKILDFSKTDMEVIRHAGVAKGGLFIWALIVQFEYIT